MNPTGGELMTENQTPGSSLALVIDDDVNARRSIRELLESRGHDVVHASNGLAGLELIQRLPSSFGMVLVELDLRGLPGAVVVETLRIFRPDLPVLCMSGRRVAALPSGCLRKPIEPEELDQLLRSMRSSAADGWELGADEDSIAVARARYAAGADLVEAALELSKGLSGNE
jgi:DNA-binding response OmpR family regulator